MINFIRNCPTFFRVAASFCISTVLYSIHIPVVPHPHQYLVLSGSCCVCACLSLLFSLLPYFPLLPQFSPESRPNYEAVYTKIFWWKGVGSMDPRGGHELGKLTAVHRVKNSRAMSGFSQKEPPWVVKLRNIWFEALPTYEISNIPYASLYMSTPCLVLNTMPYT